MTDDLGVKEVRRALISVAKKEGAIDFARALAKLGIELVSTGGTKRAIAEAGILVRDVSEFTGLEPCLDDRVKTLHHLLHGGILYKRGDKLHVATVAKHGMVPIDLIVSNLYPFQEAIKEGAAYDEAIEKIDVGGPAMIRGGSKNLADVTVVVNPVRYPRIIDELTMYGGTTLALRRLLMVETFTLTSQYDAAIAAHFAKEFGLSFDEMREIARVGHPEKGLSGL